MEVILTQLVTLTEQYKLDWRFNTAKDGSTVQYKLVTTDATSGYTTANDSSGIHYS